MKKQIACVLAALIFISGAFIFLQHQNKDDAAQAQFSYNGPYVDVVSELDRREAAHDGMIRICKVDSKTNMSVPCINMELTEAVTSDERTSHRSAVLKMPYHDEVHTLVFVNDELVGYYSESDSFEDMFYHRIRTDEATRLELLKEYENYIQKFTSAIQ